MLWYMLGNLLADEIDGARSAKLACVSCVKDKQSCHALCDHARSGIIVVRFQKGLVANLSAERQLSVAKLST